MPLDEAKTALFAVAAGPDRVSRGRRAIPIGLAAAPITFLLVIGLLVLPGIFRFMGSPERRDAALAGYPCATAYS